MQICMQICMQIVTPPITRAALRFWFIALWHRAINQNRSAQHQPISALQGLLERPFTSLSCGVGFMSQL